MQGWRISMEDSHTTVLDLLASLTDVGKAHSGRLSFFGVFDGHGGDKVALFAGENIQNIIAKQDTFKAGNYEQALKDGFLATDRAILSGGSNSRDFSPCGRSAVVHTCPSTRPTNGSSPGISLQPLLV